MNSFDRTNRGYRIRQAGSASRGQVLHLLLGDVEPDSGVDPGNCADRDANFLASPKMPFLEQYVGHTVVVRIDEKALYLPDLTVQRVDTLTALHVYFTQRDNVLDHDRPDQAALYHRGIR